ncbi:MAG: hypothetical protein WCC87_17165 [Candidatus Korobacteraceae bacterium]
MTPNELKNKVVEAFDSAKLLTSLEVDASSFHELPRLFESSHLCMRIMLNDQAAMAVASNIAAKLKSDLQQMGIELEYSIITQWKVLHFFPELLQRCEDGSWMPSESFDLELQSGNVKRLVAVRVSRDAKYEIRQRLNKVPIPDQPDAIRQLLETWVSNQAQCDGFGYWDPILYPTRTIQARDMARITLARPRQELEPQFS